MGLAERALAAVNRFYEAADGRDIFSEALADLADLLGAECSVLEIHDRASGAPVMMEEARLNLGTVGAYVEEFVRLSPRVRYGLSPTANPIAHDALILSEREIDHDPFYADFLAPQGLRYFLSMNIDPDAERFGALSLQYRPWHGAVDVAELHLAEALRPHLARAMQRMWRRRNFADAGWVENDLRRAFGLTAAEARLARSILNGQRLRDHAESRGIAMTTLHTHYDRLKHKLGCERQAALVSFLQRRYGLAQEN